LAGGAQSGSKENPMKENFCDFDSAELLDSEEAIELFLFEANRTKNAKLIAEATEIAARAKALNCKSEKIQVIPK
jgi:DNA-binding phage protein